MKKASKKLAKISQRTIFGSGALSTFVDQRQIDAGDDIAGEDIATRVHTLRHLLKQVGHDV